MPSLIPNLIIFHPLFHLKYSIFLSNLFIVLSKILFFLSIYIFIRINHLLYLLSIFLIIFIFIDFIEQISKLLNFPIILFNKQIFYILIIFYYLFHFFHISMTIIFYVIIILLMFVCLFIIHFQLQYSNSLFIKTQFMSCFQ
jgi:hypothetical protein